jgi:thiamine pyrophosphate-dependent acetolactate synthase large subunit-like protein
VNIDPADATKNYAMDAVLDVDARALESCTDECPRREPWAEDLLALGRDIRARLAAEPATADAIAFLEHTESALIDDATVFADMCIAGYWAASHLRVTRSRALHYPMGWGTLGFALPAAIGAAVTGAPTVAIVGDGGALFALGELSALAEQQPPCTIVVVDDGGYGMLRYGPTATVANDLPAVDFVTVAEGFGLEAVRIDGLGAGYGDALAAAVAARAPRLLHVRAALHPPVTTTPFWPIQDG